MEEKLKINEMIENRGRFTTIESDFKLILSTVESIMKHKHKQKAGERITPITATKFSRTRSFLMTEIQNLLRKWIDDPNKNYIHVSNHIIIDKSLSL